MQNKIKIEVADLIGSSQCLFEKDGQKIFDEIERGIKEGKQVTVSFEDVTLLIAFFLNVAIGQLYNFFDEDTIRTHLKVEGLPPEDMGMLKHVVDNAKIYFQNKKSCGATDPLKD